MAKKTVRTSSKNGKTEAKKTTQVLLEPSIKDLMFSLSEINSLEQLDSTLEVIFDDINLKLNKREFKNDEPIQTSIKEYEQKVCALRDLWKEKIIIDVNRSVHISDRGYHKRFNFHDFNLNKIKEKVESLNDDYKKYFYLKCVKCNYRVSTAMDWDKLYSQHDDISDFCIYVDSNIKKYHNKIAKFQPSAFTENPEFDYDQPEPRSFTKQFLSKLIVSFEETQIIFDKQKFCESFGIKFDDTVRTAYNKTNNKLNDTILKFFNKFNSKLSDTEREELRAIFKVKEYNEQ